ncbi:TonB-dependent siderophore receptor [Sphingorhabdus sp. Alg239-R122]|uniref:TonB-dependent siderophore receptor n=1 Tax=Sphingorhabdus sp. Alg239-R122 TaxID=2305989 RepID=UPI0013DA93F3|nr:TonB-dependent siderophore receptor [Sphingorhabdus sp. Alg239-R122]
MKYIFFLATASIAFTPVAPAFAQDSENDEAEIVVSGVRPAYRGDFEELEIPQADQIIDQETLRDAGVVDLNAALDLSASVSRQNNFGGLWNSFSIRGFSGDINLPSNFLVNGFNAGRGFGGPRDISGIEAVEVLKGPRSAVYGRGEPGGTINLITKRPQLETSGYVQFQGGSFDFYRGDIDLQTTLGDNVGVRIAGFYEDAGSFRGPKETQKYGFYPSVRFDIGESSILTYELEYTSQELPQDRGVIFSDQFGFSPRRLFTGEPDALIDTEVLGHQLEFQHNFSDDWSVLVGAGYRETSLVGDAYENNFGSRQPYLIDGETISRFFRFRDYEADYLALRAELTGEFNTGGIRHRVIVGVDYDEFDNDQIANRFRQGGIGGAPSSSLDPQTYLLIDVDNPQYGLYPRPIPAAQIDRLETTSGFGFYIQDQIDLTDKLQFRFGGRFDDFEQKLINRRSDPAAVNESSNSAFSPQAGIVFRATGGVSLYASYGEGIRQLSGTDFEGTSFDPNKSTSLEAGIKLDLGTVFSGVQGSASATVFDVDQSNILIFDSRPEAAGELIPAGEARSRGLELDANASFDSGLRVWFSYAYTDAEYTNSGTDSATFTTFDPGEPLINSPDHQLSLQASQSFAIADLAAQIGGGVLYVGERNGEVGGDFVLPDYTTIRLFGQIEPIENLAIRLDIDNLFDETFYTDSFANVWVQPGAPRTVRVSARFKF